ncbi:hypothetical protein OHS18_08390 [Amycolatopsis sp. NBC_00355]|uniref:hypothetical protein n=1 Tax=Amycolatopsis sp. NBC_00355 TaxID=2975957 RepID=UPI002E26C523
MPVRGQLGSRRLAIAVFAANLVGCALVGATWVVLNRAPEPAPPVEPGLSLGDTPATLSSPPPGIPTPTTAAEAPATLVRVSGPEGLETVIPAGWPTKTLPEPGSVQASDPADSRRILKFGGAPPSDGSDIVTYHERYERQIARRAGYTRHRLRSTTLRGAEAVDWEFAWDAPEGRRHVRAFYWRSNGIEYYVYAHGPEPSWPETAEVVQRMLDDATP